MTHADKAQLLVFLKYEFDEGYAGIVAWLIRQLRKVWWTE